MILVDTNILSELMRPAPEPAVERWLDAPPTASVFICDHRGRAALRCGTAADGQRRIALTSESEAMLEEDFSGRSLPLGSLAAQAFAVLASERRQAGEPMAQPVLGKPERKATSSW